MKTFRICYYKSAKMTHKHTHEKDKDYCPLKQNKHNATGFPN